MVWTFKSVFLRILCSHGVIEIRIFLATSPHSYNCSLMIPIELVMICLIVALLRWLPLTCLTLCHWYSPPFLLKYEWSGGTMQFGAMIYSNDDCHFVMEMQQRCMWIGWWKSKQEEEVMICGVQPFEDNECNLSRLPWAITYIQWYIISMDILNITKCLWFIENVSTRTLIFQCGRIWHMWMTQHLQWCKNSIVIESFGIWMFYECMERLFPDGWIDWMACCCDVLFVCCSQPSPLCTLPAYIYRRGCKMCFIVTWGCPWDSWDTCVLDCMHVHWKNCPITYQGAYQGKEKFSTLVLEAITDHNLWFWHAVFGFMGSCNDINILDVSPLHQQFLDGSHSKIDFEFTIDKWVFNKLFYLVDGIYPQLSHFMKTISIPIMKKEKIFAGWQEAAWKDVEHAFGVLQSRWQLLASPVKMWDEVHIHDMVTSCIILHNMMVQQWLEGGEECTGDYLEEGLPQDHDNDDSNIADEAEDHVNMLEAELSHGNLWNPQLQFQRDQMEFWTHAQMVVHKWWKMLYDKVEHKCLQQVIISRLVWRVMEMMKMDKSSIWSTTYSLFCCPISDNTAIAINSKKQCNNQGGGLCVYVLLTLIVLFFFFLIFIIRCWQGGGR